VANAHAPGRSGPPDPFGVHLLALRRVLALAEGRGPVRRRSPRGGGLPHGGGARPPCQHVVVDGGALLAGARLRGLSRAPGRRARGVPPVGPSGLRRHRRRCRPVVLARPQPVRVGGGRRPRQRGGDRPARLARRRRDGGGGHRGGRARARRRHRPDGVLRVLPAPPADAARRARGDRGVAVAGGALAPRPHRRLDARHRPLGGTSAPDGDPGDEARAPSWRRHAGDRRRDALRGGQARLLPP
ncbi:MAG: Transcriptional regulator, partial [uncultured Solirubrobacteraceae bacterium]